MTLDGGHRRYEKHASYLMAATVDETFALMATAIAIHGRDADEGRYLFSIQPAELGEFSE